MSIIFPNFFRDRLIGVVALLTIQVFSSMAFSQSDQNGVVHRQQSLPEVRRVGWSIPLPEETKVSTSTEDDLLLLSDSTGVHGLHLSSGLPAWPVGENDFGYLLQSIFAPEKSNSKPSAGTVHKIRGSTYWTAVVPGTSLGTRLTPLELVSLNLTAQGRLEWRQSSEELMNEQNWSFASAPLVKGDEVFILLHHPQKGWRCAALNSSGNRIWSHPVLNLQGDFDTVQLQKSGASLFVITGQNAIELIIHDSIIRERLFEVASSSNDRGTLETLVTETHLVRLCGSQLDIWERTGGTLLFSRVLPVHLTFLWGETQGNMILSGKSLMAMDVNSGKETWRLAPASPGLQGVGRGVMMNGSLLWPTGDELWQIGLAAGEIEKRIPLRQLTGIHGGDLMLLKNSLLIHRSDSISLLELVQPR
ncbi:MAG TPA: hypothetical protein VNQ76_12545 [Planctomicrobium sp.]|nr:hypothetical protein [Planctomicrobium sp.]